MKISILLLFILVLPLAVAYVNDFFFYAVTEDGDTEVDNLYAQVALEDEETFYFFLGPKSEAVPITCYDSGDTCIVTYKNISFHIATDDDNFVIAVNRRNEDDDYVSIETDPEEESYGGVYINGWNFYAKHNADDPLMFSEDKFSILAEPFEADSSTFGFTLQFEKAPRNTTVDSGIFNPSNIEVEVFTYTHTSGGRFDPKPETDSSTASSRTSPGLSSVNATSTSSGRRSSSTTARSSFPTISTTGRPFSFSATEDVNAGSQTEEASNSDSPSITSDQVTSSTSGEESSSENPSSGSQTSSGGAQSKYFNGFVGIIPMLLGLL